MSLIVSQPINNISYIIKNRTDFIQSYLVDGKQWNDEIITIIKNYFFNKRLGHLVNIGAHIGTVSLPLSLYVNKITAIEAYPPTYNHLCENIKYNNINNIITYNIAVGNKNDHVYFMSEDKICPKENINRIKTNSGGMHVFTEEDIQYNRRSANLTDKKMKVEMCKFDDLDINNFDIMLVDIEGFEYEFLLGAKERLIKNKPIIIIEIWNNYKRQLENMSTTQEYIINFIQSLNYKLVKKLGDDFIFESY